MIISIELSKGDNRPHKALTELNVRILQPFGLCKVHQNSLSHLVSDHDTESSSMFELELLAPRTLGSLLFPRNIICDVSETH